MKPALKWLLLVSVLILNASVAVENQAFQEFVDFYDAYFKTRTNIVPAELAKKLRQELQNGAKTNVNVDLSPLKKFYPESDWQGLVACYENRSCRIVMLATLWEWSLKEFHIVEYTPKKDWVELYYTGTQMDGEKGHGSVTIYKTAEGLKIGMSCWLKGVLSGAQKRC